VGSLSSLLSLKACVVGGVLVETGWEEWKKKKVLVRDLK